VTGKAMQKDYVLQIENLQTKFTMGKKVVNAVNDVSLKLRRGTTLGVVGESGCGKSVTALSVMQLLPKAATVTNGRIIYSPKPGESTNLIEYGSSSKEIRRIRGKDISMIFQDPLSSLDPVYTIGSQIMENLLAHEKLDKKVARERIVNLLGELGIPSPADRYKSYPFEFSGGMKQRVMIAIGMICNPNILIADEPTTALDVTIQAQILSLIKAMQEEHGTSVMLITHNMGIVAESCDDVAVMYMGRVVEFGALEQIFDNPLHPYTQALLRSVPVLGMGKDKDLESIEGSTPDASITFAGCEFEPRCPNACAKCKEAHPPLTVLEDGHEVLCWLYEEGKAI
jgi:peptide/nickel transport system ATP-binding protein